MNRRPGRGRRLRVLHDLFNRKRQMCQNQCGPLDGWSIAFGRGRGSSRSKCPKIRTNPRKSAAVLNSERRFSPGPEFCRPFGYRSWVI